MIKKGAVELSEAYLYTDEWKLRLAQDLNMPIATMCLACQLCPSTPNSCGVGNDIEQVAHEASISLTSRLIVAICPDFVSNLK